MLPLPQRRERKESSYYMSNTIRLCAFADEADPLRAGQIAAMKANGVGLLEVRGVDGINIASLPEETAKLFKKELDENGLAVWSIGSPAGKTPITQDFAVEQRQFEHLLRMAEIFDAKCIRLFSFYGTNGEEKWFDEVCRRLEGFVDMAKGTGVTLCHENEKGIYGDTAARCLQLHRAVSGIKAVFDPANFIQCGQDVMQAWELLAPYVFYGHIKDCDETGRVVPPGDGIGALRQYIPLFARDGHDVLTLEPHLTEFVGLAGLENGDKSVVGQVVRFENSRAAFDYAADKLKGILAEI